MFGEQMKLSKGTGPNSSIITIYNVMKIMAVALADDIVLQELIFLAITIAAKRKSLYATLGGPENFVITVRFFFLYTQGLYKLLGLFLTRRSRLKYDLEIITLLIPMLKFLSS